jgi:parvulin-like peptidyl-prolyl isomerase
MPTQKPNDFRGFDGACTLVWGHGGCTAAGLAMTIEPRRRVRQRLLLAPLLAAAIGSSACTTASGAKTGAAPASPPKPAAAAVPAAAPAASPPSANAPAAPAQQAGAPAAGPAAGTFSAELRIPLLDGAFASVPIARVDDEIIELDEVVDAMAMSHEGAAERKEKAGKKDVLAVLDRLVDLRLFVVEARDMKLDELPEVKRTIADFERITLRETLKKRAVKGVVADPAEVEGKYKDATREWKVKSALFKIEAEAKEMTKSLRAGKPFDDVAKAAIEAKKAETIVTTAEVLPPNKMFPQVRAALEKLKAGGVTDPVLVPGGYAVLAVVEVTHRDDPAIKTAAENASVTNRSVATLRKYYEALKKKHAKVNAKAVDRIDLEAKKPGMAALAKSTEVLATIAGEKPITVGDLIEEINRKYFHGTDSAVKEKRLNQEKWYTFDQFLFRRLLDKEAVLERIPEDRGYKKEVANFAREQLFSTFMGRALLPDVRVPEADVRAYYDQHQGEFAYARFFKLDGLAFDSAAHAQAALDTLNAGNEMKWVKEHAEGRVDDARATFRFDGRTISSSAMPPEFTKLLESAKRGDHRLFGGDDGVFYVVKVLEDTPPQRQPFEEAKEAIVKKLYGEKANAKLKEWAAKLRAGHDVEVFITRVGG